MFDVYVWGGLSVRVRRLAICSLILLSVTSTEVTYAAPDSASELVPLKSVGTPLPVQAFSAIELDEDRGRLYLAQGTGSGLPLVITDLDGVLQTEVTALANAADVVLTNDHGTLLVVQNSDHITAVDADTLTPSGTYAGPAGACLRTVEQAGEKVVAGYSDCGIGSSGLLIWTAPDTVPVVYADAPDDPVIDASDGLVVAGSARTSPITTYVIDVSTASPSIVSERWNTGGNLQDLAISPDAAEVVESAGAPYEHHSYRLPDLSDGAIYPTGAYPFDAAWSGDGSKLAVARYWGSSTEADVLIHARDTVDPEYAVNFRGGDELQPGSLLVNSGGTRAWAVTSGDQDLLLHSFGPAHPPTPPTSDIGIAAQAGSGKEKDTAYVTATWTSPISRSGSADVEFIYIYARTDGEPERLLARVVMTDTGTYTVADALPHGTTTFTARYQDPEGWYPPDTATATLIR